jgi:hypothetical protein
MITWFDSEWELNSTYHASDAYQGKSCSGVGSCKYPFLFRGVAEWLMAAVLKTVLLKGNGGSNPSSSAIVTIRKNDGTDAKYEMETFETQ